MTRRPDDDTPPPPGGGAAERLRQELAARFGEDKVDDKLPPAVKQDQEDTDDADE